jgi:PEP-CTERM/exosortase A-associated glycosyltransferase
MRILHILDHSLPVQSGYAFRSHSILVAQKRSGLDSVALTSPKHYESWQGDVRSVEEMDGVTYFRSPATSKSVFPLLSEIRLMIQLAKSISRLIREQRPTVLHPHSPTLNAIPAILVGRLKGVPVAYEMRSSWEDAAADRGTYGANSWKYRLGKWLETWACKKADAVIVICEGLKKELIERGIPDVKITVVPNGVDIDLFTGSNFQMNGHSTSANANRKIIGFMGSFFRWEGLDLLVDAMARLAGMRSDVALLLVGGGEMVDELKDKVRNLKLESYVIMPGQVTQDKIPALYSQVDIMAFPRHSTRLTELVTPLKPLEAMAMGKAVVASDVGGHKELIRHRDTGLLFRAGDVDALVAQLQEVLDNADLRHSLEKRGVSWVQNERSWSKTTQPYAQLYKRVSVLPPPALLN